MRQIPTWRAALLLSFASLSLGSGLASARAGSTGTLSDGAQMVATTTNGADAMNALVDQSSRIGTRTIDAIPGNAPIPVIVTQAHAQTLRPAPMPDQDFDGPGLNAEAIAAQNQTHVQPSFYSRGKHFAGDGFADGSTLDGNRANRAKPGGGMSLSIPMP